MVRLDWIPLHIDRIMLSPKWRQMQDFQRGWYIQLLLEMTRAAKIGYLPLNHDLLWKLAGARRKDFWMSQNELVMACFKVQSAEGARWIYNDLLLHELEKQSLKLVEKKESRNKKPISISSLSFQIYENYPRKEGRTKALESIETALTKLSEEKAWSREMAAGFINDAVKEFATSPAGHRKAADGSSLVPHPSTWFNQGRYLDDRQNWYTEVGGGKTSKFAEIDRLLGSTGQAAD